MKNGFYSMLKALFIREIFRFLSWHFRYIGKRLDKKAKVNKKIYDVIFWGCQSKTFDCLCHELLTAKRNAYGVRLPALELIHDYLSNRKERTKIEDKYSVRSEILLWVLQGLIFGPLLFNIFLVYLFLAIKVIDIASCADDGMPFLVEENIKNAY